MQPCSAESCELRLLENPEWRRTNHVRGHHKSRTQSILEKEDHPRLTIRARRRSAVKEASLADPEVDDAAIADLVLLHCHLTGAGAGAFSAVDQLTSEAEAFQFVKFASCESSNQRQLVVVRVSCWREGDVELTMERAGDDRAAWLPCHGLVTGNFSLHHEHILALKALIAALSQRDRVDAACQTLRDSEYGMSIVENSQRPERDGC